MPSRYLPPFIVIQMPINEKGEGPEMDQSKVNRVLWQVWDMTLQTVSSHDTEAEAISAMKKAERKYS